MGGSLYQSGEAGGCWAGPGRPLRGWAEMLTVSHVLGSLQSPGVIPQETDIRACGLCPRQRLKRHPCRWRPPGCPLSPSAPQGAPPERKEARRAEEVAQLPTLTNSCPPRTPEGQEGAGRTAGMAGGREDEARGHGARGHRGHGVTGVTGATGREPRVHTELAAVNARGREGRKERMGGSVSSEGQEAGRVGGSGLGEGRVPADPGTWLSCRSPGRWTRRHTRKVEMNKGR